jgi:hypothetical protein
VPIDQSAPPSPRAGHIARNVVTAVVVAAGAAGFAFFGFLAWFGMCGISGCSGGGFGRSTDPAGTRLSILLAAACLLVALLGRAAITRSLRSAGYAVVIAVVATVALGAAIGADWRGCPRSISYETCLAESR